MAKIPIKIPTYINSVEYAPATVLPRIFFYNGQLQCEPFYFNGVQIGSFPYFDNYNVVSGSFPTTNSKSLLFNNENAAYGSVPTNNLYSSYWQTYVELLYNPKTRLLDCSAIIPLADYFHMNLNDIVEFRGNYWHLRAINDYNLKNGECLLQLLGPIIPDALTPTTTTTSTTTSTTSTTTTSTTTTTTAGPTTTTTTAAPTTTTTTVASDCRCYNINVTAPNTTVEYTDCFNLSVIKNTFYPSVGNYGLCADQYSPNVIGGAATITLTGGCADGHTCGALTTTTTTSAPTTTTTTSAPTTTTTTVAPTTTTTTVAPTTTTTTQAPFSAVCSIGSTAYTACYAPILSGTLTSDNTSFCSAGTLSGAVLATLGNGNYYVSYGGNTINIIISGAPTTTATVTSGGCATCPAVTTTTTTAAPTTTTTAAPSYDFYLANEYDCNTPPCSTIRRTDVPVAFPAGYSYIGTHYYNDINLDGFLYKITGTTTPQVAIILDPTLPHGTNCTSICAV